jgi:hypothetical protein
MPARNSQPPPAVTPAPPTPPPGDLVLRDAFPGDAAAIERCLNWSGSCAIRQHKFARSLGAALELEHLPPELAASTVEELAAAGRSLVERLADQEALRCLCRPARARVMLLLDNLASCCVDLVGEARSGRISGGACDRFHAASRLMASGLTELGRDLSWAVSERRRQLETAGPADPDADLKPLHREILRAVAGATEPVAAAAIARKIGRSPSITTHLCGELVALGRLTSVRGCAGGYLPAPDPNPANPANILPA